MAEVPTKTYRGNPDKEEDAFFARVSEVSDGLYDYLCKHVEETMEGRAVALEAVQELYQFLLAVEIFSFIDDVEAVEKQVSGEPAKD